MRPAAGTRSRAILALVAVGLAGVFGPRPADPFLADPTLAAAHREQVERVAEALAADLEAIAGRLEAALEDGRLGAGRVLNGKEAPGAALREAAAAVGGSAGTVGDLAPELRRLDGLLAACSPPADGPRAPLTLGELAQLAAAFESAATAADDFVALRWASEATLEALATALGALEREDPQAALEAIGRAEAELREVEAWLASHAGAPGLPTLRVWIVTAGRLTAALSAIAEAALFGDADALARAQREYAEAADDARTADHALGIALADGGASVTASALSGLSAALRATRASISALAALDCG